MYQVTSHPKLSVSNELKVFLEATEDVSCFRRRFHGKRLRMVRIEGRERERERGREGEGGGRGEGGAKRKNSTTVMSNCSSFNTM